ncbi:hypothetical protein LEMLEM_LOCUS4198 [Lemmus lemmus]
MTTVPPGAVFTCLLRCPGPCSGVGKARGRRKVPVDLRLGAERVWLEELWWEVFGLSGKRIAWRRNQEAKPTTHLLFILLLKSTGQDGIWARNSHGRPPHGFLCKMENRPAFPPELFYSGPHSSLEGDKWTLWTS